MSNVSSGMSSQITLNGNKNIAIVGGGLVGALNAIYFAKIGYKVDVYEGRDDIRTSNAYSGRSINLALSTRGIEALKAVGLDTQVVPSGIPMYARLIHQKDGRKYKVPYTNDGKGILSVDRRKLNELLLSEAEKYSNVSLHFEHRLQELDANDRHLTFKNAAHETVSVKPDCVIGNDGAFSAVRKHFLSRQRFNFSQTYIPHGYKELSIGPVNGEFQMESNVLHIWPRQTYMMIALPNQDKSFTCTLFMPFEIFETITDEAKLMAFFEENFADAIPLMGKDNLIHDFFKNPTSSLVSIKCSPYHINDYAVLMGDAAHAMVPFYGQGMNCGFEDCLVMKDCLERSNGDFGKAIAEFSVVRNPDAEAICDLAMYNYVEMRSSVTSAAFLFRKKLDSILHAVLPQTFIPLYTMVTFTRIPYSEVVKRWKWQNKTVDTAGYVIVGAAALTGAALLLKKHLNQ